MRSLPFTAQFKIYRGNNFHEFITVYHNELMTIALSEITKYMQLDGKITNIQVKIETIQSTRDRRH